MTLDNTVAIMNSQNKPSVSMSKDDVELKKQTDNFEAIMLKYLLDMSMNEENSLFPKGPGSEIYKSMYTDELSKSLTGSFGYSELLFNHLKENR